MNDNKVTAIFFICAFGMLAIGLIGFSYSDSKKYEYEYKWKSDSLNYVRANSLTKQPK